MLSQRSLNKLRELLEKIEADSTISLEQIRAINGHIVGEGFDKEAGDLLMLVDSELDGHPWGGPECDEYIALNHDDLMKSVKTILGEVFERIE